MNINVTSTYPSTDGIVRIAAKGEFDALGCKDIRKDLETYASEYIGLCIEFDLEEVSFIDSSGIGAIVFLYKRMLEHNGSLKLKGVKGQPKELLTLLRVDNAIPVEWSTADVATKVEQ